MVKLNEYRRGSSVRHLQIFFCILDKTTFCDHTFYGTQILIQNEIHAIKHCLIRYTLKKIKIFIEKNSLNIIDEHGDDDDSV